MRLAVLTAEKIVKKALKGKAWKDLCPSAKAIAIWASDNLVQEQDDCPYCGKGDPTHDHVEACERKHR